jgi:hypothetical protein
VTAYSSLNFDEDFVEMIAMMLTEGKAGFDKIVNSQFRKGQARGV